MITNGSVSGQMNTDVNTKPARTVVLLIAIILIVTSVIVLAWGFDKGFLLTDGGHYVLRYQDKQPSETSTWILEHLLVKAIVPSDMRDIVSLRYIGLIINLLSSAFFGFALSVTYRRIHRRSINLIFLVLIALAGLVVSYPGMPAELSYNSLSQFFILLAAALVVLSTLFHGGKSLVLAGLAGFAGAFLTLVKIPAGMAFLCLALIVLFIAGKKTSALVFLGLLMLTVIVIMQWLDLDLNWFQNNLRQMVGNPQKNHFLVRITAPLVFAWTWVQAMIFAGLIAFTWKKFQDPEARQGIRTSALIIFTLCLTVWMGYHVLRHAFGYSITSDFLVSGVLIICFALMFRSGSIKKSFPCLLKKFKQKRSFVAVFVLLLLVPLAGAIGSWVELNLISKYYLISILGLLALLLPWFGKIRCNLLLAGLSLYLVFMGLWQYVYYPFGLKPLFRQTEYFREIRFEPEMAEFLRHTEKVLSDNGFIEQQGIIAPLSPGLVYLMGSHQPGGIIWSENYLDDYFDNLRKTHLQMLPVIISQSGGLEDEFIEGFNRSTGLDFNRDYWLADSSPSCAGVTNIFFPNESDKTKINTD